MNWDDECYLLSKGKFRENANIINVFTSKKGKVGGVVYGGNSRKIRNYLQISNKIFVSHISKSENKIGYFKTEVQIPNSKKIVGIGSSKKNAQQNAAAKLLKILNI